MHLYVDSYYSPVKQSKKTVTLRGHISRRVKISPIEKLPIKIQWSETQSSHYFHETLPRNLISTNEKNHIKSFGGTFFNRCHLWSDRVVPGCPSSAPQVCLWTLERLINTFLFSAVGLHPLGASIEVPHHTDISNFRFYLLKNWNWKWSTSQKGAGETKHAFGRDVGRFSWHVLYYITCNDAKHNHFTAWHHVEQKLWPTN